MHLNATQDYGFPRGFQDVTFAVRFGADGKPDSSFAQNQLIPGLGVRLNDGKILSQSDFGVASDCKLVRWLTDGEPRVDGIMVEYFHPGLRHYFMTLDTFEAAGLDAVPYGWERTGRTFAAWHLEGKPLRVALPSAAGTCPGNLDPVYRVFNGPVDNANGPTHRYTTDPALYAQMQSLGWLPEGAHFCAPPLGPR